MLIALPTMTAWPQCSTSTSCGEALIKTPRGLTDSMNQASSVISTPVIMPASAPAGSAAARGGFSVSVRRGLVVT